MNINEFLEPAGPFKQQANDADRGVSSVAVAMVKNEADIIKLWISHVLAVFDRLIVVDHMSTDGTFEFLSEISSRSDRVTLFRFISPGFYKEEVINEIAVSASSSFPNAWVMPLDADELIHLPEKGRFSDLFSETGNDKIVSFRWRTAIPYDVSHDRDLPLGERFLHSPESSGYIKCAMHSSMIREAGYRFSRGSHNAYPISTGGYVPEDQYFEISELIHIPLRSIDHLHLKVVQGQIGYEAMAPSKRKKGQGHHWLEIIRLIKGNGVITDDLVRRAAHDYGAPGRMKLKGLTVYNLVEKGWTQGTLDVATETVPCVVERRRTFKEMVDELMKSTKDSGRSLSASDTVFSALSESEDKPVNVPSDVEFLTEFTGPAFMINENNVFSTWTGHIPFMFCLMSYLRPRRYVELGTHYGASFFAACQISRSFSDITECLAIDTWQGDEQAGTYGEDVFDKFHKILRRSYSGCGKYIRNNFDSALSRFEDASVDLLHIDGLHTYEAVKHDYENWRSKLSSSGVIMFHDTHVRDGDFGVYRLWEELKEQYPSIEFEQSYGLGVIFTGTDGESCAADLLRKLTDKDISEFVRSFFMQVSDLKGYYMNTPYELFRNHGLLGSIRMKAPGKAKGALRSLLPAWMVRWLKSMIR